MKTSMCGLEYSVTGRVQSLNWRSSHLLVCAFIVRTTHMVLGKYILVLQHVCAFDMVVVVFCYVHSTITDLSNTVRSYAGCCIFILRAVEL